MTQRYELATSSWDDDERKAIAMVVQEDMTTMGKHVAAFESEFAQYMGSKYAVMVNSGSSANLLMTAVLFYKKENPLKRGDEVIVPAVSWPTTYYPLYQYGLKLKFVDIDLNTLNYNLNALEQAVSDRTRAIMAVNLLGNPNNFARIKSIIGGRAIYLIEDNCESMDARFEGKKAGTFGLMGTFSTFFSHHMSTMEGGVIVTDDEECYHLLLSLRAHGWTRNLPKHNLVCSEKSDDRFSELFRFVLPGYNMRPIEMEGAIGLCQLKKLPRFVEWRQKNAEYFQNKFKDNPYFTIQRPIGSPSWFGFALLIRPDSGIDRHEMVNYLIENGIETRPIVAGDFTKNEVLKYFDCEIFGEMKNAQYIDKYGFFVGNHQFDIHDKIDYLDEVLKKFMSQKGM